MMVSRILTYLSGVFCLLPFASLAIAQPSLQCLFPPAVSIGDEATVRVEGKFAAWPTEVYCDRGDVTIVAGEEEGLLHVAIPDGTQPGIAWLRIIDTTGVSDTKPLCIQAGKMEIEEEPNDDFAEANWSTLPSTICGRLEKRGDVDCFHLQSKAGEWLYANLQANRVLQSPMDSVLQLVDARGHVVAQSDDQLGLDPQLAYHCKVDQELMIRLFCFPETPNSTIGFAGGSDYVYRLQLATSPIVDHILPLFGTVQSNQLAAYSMVGPTDSNPKISVLPATELSPPIASLQARGSLDDIGGWQFLKSTSIATSILEGQTDNQPLQPPLIYSGHISRPQEVDEFQFTAESGVSYEIYVHSQQFGFPMDSKLAVVDDQGKQIAENDDRARRPYDAGVTVKAERSGPLRIRISDLAQTGSWHHAYSVTVEPVTPRAELTVATDHFSAAAGDELDLPITVARQHGYDQQLNVTAIDLPASVSCEAMTSKPKGDSSKSIKLKFRIGADAEKGHFRFGVQGRGQQPEANPIDAQYAPRLGIQARRFWLTIQ